MKRVVILAVLLLPALAMGQTVLSANIVGYQKVDLTPLQGFFCKVNFSRTDGQAMHAGDLIQGNLPDGTQIYFWNTTASTWRTDTYNADNETWSPGVKSYKPGDSIYISPGFGVPQETYYGVFLGEVLTDSATIPVYNGFTGVSYPFPVEVTYEQTSLGQVMLPGDTCYRWTGTGWAAVTRTSTGWNPADRPIAIDRGLLLWRQGGTADWVESCPY